MIPRLALLPILLTACSAVTLPPPARCEVDDLPPGVLAEADLETYSITVSPEWGTLPTAVQWVVLAHEACHLRGHYTEAGADCCAARAVAGMCGRVLVLEGAVWLQARGYDVTMLVECVP